MSGSASINLSQRSAEELARQAQAGCSRALDVLMDRYGKVLERYLLRRCGHAQDAEDLAQETMLRVWKNLEKYDPGRPFEPWLFAVARNLAANQYEGSRRGESVTWIAEPISEQANPAERLIEQESNDNLWAEVKQLLGERQYTALRLRYGRDMSVKQVARAMGLTRTYVKVTLFRARRKLLRSDEFQRWIYERG